MSDWRQTDNRVCRTPYRRGSRSSVMYPALGTSASRRAGSYTVCALQSASKGPLGPPLATMLPMSRSFSGQPKKTLSRGSGTCVGTVQVRQPGQVEHRIEKAPVRWAGGLGARRLGQRQKEGGLSEKAALTERLCRTTILCRMLVIVLDPVLCVLIHTNLPRERTRGGGVPLEGQRCINMGLAWADASVVARQR